MAEIFLPQRKSVAHSTLTTFSPSSLGVQTLAGGRTINSQAWLLANLVLYIPFQIADSFLVSKIGWTNGTSPANNIDVGVYDESGAKLGSTGSTPAGTSAVIQVVDVTDFTIPGPGRYYFGVTCDNIAYTLRASVGIATEWASMGVMEETTGSFGLPGAVGVANAWTPIVTTRAYLPALFIARSASF